jgi:hypothetical protein
MQEHKDAKINSKPAFGLVAENDPLQVIQNQFPKWLQDS